MSHFVTLSLPASPPTLSVVDCASVYRLYPEGWHWVSFEGLSLDGLFFSCPENPLPGSRQRNNPVSSGIGALSVLPNLCFVLNFWICSKALLFL